MSLTSRAILRWTRGRNRTGVDIWCCDYICSLYNCILQGLSEVFSIFVWNQDVAHCTALDKGEDEHAGLNIILLEEVGSLPPLEPGLSITNSEDIKEEGSFDRGEELTDGLQIHWLDNYMQT